MFDSQLRNTIPQCDTSIKQIYAFIIQTTVLNQSSQAFFIYTFENFKCNLQLLRFKIINMKNCLIFDEIQITHLFLQIARSISVVSPAFTAPLSKKYQSKNIKRREFEAFFCSFYLPLSFCQ